MKNTILTFPIITYILYCIVGCSNPTKNEANVRQSEELQVKNEVIVLGMIHSGHKTSKKYGLETLKNIIKKIEPDYILTEIPPDRFDAALEEFNTTDTITEARVVRFPEYVDVIFPLTKEIDFEIIPTAGWTQEMAQARSKRLREISESPEWANQWSAYKLAGERADSALSLLGDRDDPLVVNTAAYDEAYELELSVYNTYFNDELGDGGWDNINNKHYSYIEKALDQYKNKGKRILITYGAGHKGWFLRQLNQRNDIEILDPIPFIKEALNLNN